MSSSDPLLPNTRSSSSSVTSTTPRTTPRGSPSPRVNINSQVIASQKLCIKGNSRWCWWFAVIFFAFLSLLPIYINYRIVTGVEDQAIFTGPHSSGYPQFLNRNVQGRTTNEFYIFNITNPHQVLAGAKPHVEEIGPFIYACLQIRDDLKWDNDKDTLSFRQWVSQTFDANATSLATHGKFNTDQIKVTTWNILFWGVRAQIGPSAWHTLTLDVWPNDYARLFEFRSVREIVFGYRIHIANGLVPVDFPGIIPNHPTPQDDPEWVIPTTVSVGKHDTATAHDIVSWGEDGDHTLIKCPWGMFPIPGLHWCPPNNDPCCGGKVRPWSTEIIESDWNPDVNKVRGTFGDAFRPWLKRKDSETVVIFSDVIRRALRFNNTGGRTDDHLGIEMLRFLPSRDFWMNATEWPANRRLHQFGPHGLVNITIIQSGAPVFVSLPHFLRCEPSLLNDVDGLHPDESIHEFFLDIEAHVGTTFREHQRIQVNVKIEGRQGKWLPHVKDAYVPVLWYDSHSEILQPGVDEFMDLYNGMSLMWGAACFGSVGFTLVVVGSVVLNWFAAHHKMRRDHHDTLRSLEI